MASVRANLERSTGTIEEGGVELREAPGGRRKTNPRPVSTFPLASRARNGAHIEEMRALEKVIRTTFGTDNWERSREVKV